MAVDLVPSDRSMTVRVTASDLVRAFLRNPQFTDCTLFADELNFTQSEPTTHLAYMPRVETGTVTVVPSPSRANGGLHEEEFARAITRAVFRKSERGGAEVPVVLLAGRAAESVPGVVLRLPLAFQSGQWDERPCKGFAVAAEMLYDGRFAPSATAATCYPAVVGAALRALMAERILSQAEFATKLGVAPSTISRIFAGLAPASVDMLASMGEVFQVEPGFLLALADQLAQVARRHGIVVFRKRHDSGVLFEDGFIEVDPSILERLAHPLVAQRERPTLPNL